MCFYEVLVYKFISFVLHPRLSLKLFKKIIISWLPINPLMEMKGRDWKEEIKELSVPIMIELIYNHYFIING